MYVYIQSEPRLFTVGFYDPQGTWNPESDHSDSEAAAKRVAWLNGSKSECVKEHEPDEFALHVASPDPGWLPLVPRLT